MAKFELKLPKMGESVAEATITNWLKELVTKLKRMRQYLKLQLIRLIEVPSEVSGILVEQLFAKDDLV
jgi:2-oxoglutarate dehydrogenase E2 component (dihydrolipoamide succinyltransferase)